MNRTADAWPMSHRVVLILGIAIAIVIRLVLLPRPGLVGDDEDFLEWARAIAANGLGKAYDEPISFPPVLPWIWWALGTVAPALVSATPDDPAALAVLKLPASLADFGMAAIVGWSLATRGHRGWAIAAALAVLLMPATWYVSALWGQFESLYVLPMLAGWALVTRGRPGWAAVAVAIGLMTKPQALPLVVPFAAFYLRRYGLGASIRAGGIATATAAVLWLPFLASDGLARYAENLADYASLFAWLSLNAWNPWWVLQIALAPGGGAIPDTVAIAGPITFRWMGVAVAGLLGLAIFTWVWRRPTPTALAWGLAATSLAAFLGLTSMHERYSYPAVIFLLLAWPNRWAVGTWLLAAAVVSLNLVAAIPPSEVPGSWIPVGGAVGVAGTAAMVVLFVAVLIGLRRESATEDGSGGGSDIGVVPSRAIGAA